MSASSRPRSLALVGPGRAGLSVTIALRAVGWEVVGVAGRSVDAASVREAAARFGATAGTASDVARGVDLVVIACPDASIPSVAAAVGSGVGPETLVIHLAGAVGVGVLDGLPCRVGALHPLQTLPSGDRGAATLSGSWCAVAGDPAVESIARELGLTPFPVRDEDRAAYHAAACIASNHLVALLAQVDACTDVPLGAFLPLVRATVENVAEIGPVDALTGPVARGDTATVRAHLAAIPEGERVAYVALARRAAVIAGRDPDLGGALA